MGEVVLWRAFDIEPGGQDEEQSKLLDSHWKSAADAAAADASAIDSAIEHARIDAESFAKTGVYDDEYLDDVLGGIAAWRSLETEMEFDLAGIFRRRSLAPFVLVPRHVAKTYGESDPLSLLPRLRQAQEAFVFGVPLAALALMRSILELLLQKNYGGTGHGLKNLIGEVARRGLFPSQIGLPQINRLMELGNDALHPNPQHLHNVNNLEKEILSLLIILRTLIEEAPS